MRQIEREGGGQGGRGLKKIVHHLLHLNWIAGLCLETKHLIQFCKDPICIKIGWAAWFYESNQIFY